MQLKHLVHTEIGGGFSPGDGLHWLLIEMFGDLRPSTASQSVNDFFLSWQNLTFDT